MILKTLQDRLFINLSNPGLTHNLKRKLKGNTNLLRRAVQLQASRDGVLQVLDISLSQHT